ncbi:MAG: adenosine deaminase, partial [Spirochaetia bacterium]|nr:adenosine deaminase [Spirochaetia bacterium]
MAAQTENIGRGDSLPLIDLHLHIDGAVRTTTMIDLAREQKLPLPTFDPAALERLVRVSPNCRSLSEFLATFNVFYDLLKTPEAIERITYELCTDLAGQGLIYAELRFAPVLNIPEPSDFEAGMRRAVHAAMRGVERGTRGGAFSAGIILCCYRGFHLKYAEETVRIAHEVATEASRAGKDSLVVGVDLAGDESRYQARDFKSAFDLAHSYGIPVTVHAAEAAGPESAAAALDILGARRIGHGIRIREDDALLNRVIRDRIPLEICLTSNLQTATVSRLKDHPFKQYLDSGVHVTLNTDDPSVSGITLAGEWSLARSTFGLSDSNVEKILLFSADAAFCSTQKKEALKQRIAAAFHPGTH